MSAYNPTQIQAELSDKLEGELRFSQFDRVLYSTDSSIFKIDPAGVVIPKTTNDVVEVVKYCHTNKIPITARGAGSGLAGSAINTGIIIDFTKYMNRVLEVNDGENWVKVQPGVCQGPLNAQLKPYDKFFPPNPSSSDYCTIGGMIGNNASGGKSVKYGFTKDYVQTMELVLHNGEVVRTKIYKEDDPEFKALLKEDSEWGRINRELYNLCKDNAQTIEDNTPKIPKNCCGYNLKETLQDGVFNINKVIIGSEGTLAIVTEATLGIARLPKAKQSAMLFFTTLERGGEAIHHILEFGPSTCEIMAADFINLVKEDRPEVATFMPDEVGTALLLEFEGENEAEVSEKMQKCVDHLRKVDLLLDAKIATDASDQAKLWAMRKAALPLIYNRPGVKMPVTFVEDCTIPPARLPEYINGVFAIFKKYGVDATAYGHAGDGNIHTRPLMNLRKQEYVDKLVPIADEVYTLAASLGATFSGEHGDGHLRAQFLPRLFGPLWETFKELKAIMDPDGVMNPDRIISTEESPLTTHHRMGNGNYRVVPTQTMVDLEEVRINLEKCHGCGKCRTFCPMVDAVYDEMALPRGKINLARALVYGELDPASNLATKEIKELLDLCYNCKTCLLDCPTHVDTGLILSHLRNYYFDHKGAKWGEKKLADADKLSRLAMRAPLSNKATQWGFARFFMDKIMGVAPGRYMPPFAKKELRKVMPKHIPGRGAGKIAYFTGCYANFNEVQDGYALLKILEHLGYEVIIPEQRCCGLAKQAGIGNYKGAMKDNIAHNVASLKTAVDQGYTVLTACPSCYHMLKEEMLELDKSAEAKTVAGSIREATDFLWELVQQGKLKDLGELKLKVAYKNPCHANASGIKESALNLLKAIPGVDLVTDYDTCCGMAGTYGMKTKNYDRSMTIAEPMTKALLEAQADEYCTTCGTCTIQMVQGLDRPVISPLLLVARSLGLYDEGGLEMETPQVQEEAATA